MSEEGEHADDLIPVSALQHYSYCPRQCGLIHLEQAFDENVHTMRGRAVHRQVDEPGSELLHGTRLERALPITCQRLGLIGRADLVEFSADGTPYPVEYKHGRKRKWVHDELQLTAQALCLEEMSGKTVLRGALYYATSKRRREVAITIELRAAVERVVGEIRRMLDTAKLPAPVADSRCRECSLRECCQPDALSARQRFRTLRNQLFDAEEERCTTS